MISVSEYWRNKSAAQCNVLVSK